MAGIGLTGARGRGWGPWITESRAAGGRHLSYRLWEPAALGALCLLALLAAVLAPPASTAHAQAREVASYQIQVRLEPAAKRLLGSERVTFLNDTSRPVQELYLHLYPNAFSGPNTTFMRESPSAARQAAGRQAATENAWGEMVVSALRLSSGWDLLPQSTVDETIMRVPLPEPLGSGQSLQLEAEFTVKLPWLIARMGYQGDTFTIAQWFPKLAALTERGWIAHQYHANSEFFADFGSYEVEITLPERYLVGASGVPVGERANGDGTRSLTFSAPSVHDFAWVASPRFREAWGKAGDTDIRLLYPPEHEDRKDRFLGAAVAALESFGRWFGPYPYPRLTVVDVPEEAGAGMEYPTLVTVSSTDPPIPGLLLEEEVTVHEIGHQWWYGMVASNEFEEAWLDEGFTTYSTRKLMEKLYGKEASMGNFLGLQVGGLAYNRGRYLETARLDPVVQDSWKFYSHASYASNVYSKADLVLGTLEGYLGSETMGEVLRRYFQRYAFRHPTTEDFLGVVQEVSGQGFDRFFQQALFSTAVFDYSVESPEVRRSGDLIQSTITVRRLGDGILPVEVVTTFEDGQREREVWDGEARWQRYEYSRPAPPIKVEVDPERKLLLDANWANNSHTTWYNAEPILKRTADLLWLLQGWLRLLAYLF